MLIHVQWDYGYYYNALYFQLDTDEITVENALTRGFDKIIHLYLEPIWHLIGPKTKQLVADIKTLRTLLECVCQQ